MNTLWMILVFLHVSLLSGTGNATLGYEPKAQAGICMLQENSFTITGSLKTNAPLTVPVVYKIIYGIINIRGCEASIKQTEKGYEECLTHAIIHNIFLIVPLVNSP